MSRNPAQSLAARVSRMRDMLCDRLQADDMAALDSALVVIESAAAFFDNGGRLRSRTPRMQYTTPRVHGEFRMYAAGCRCDECRRANRERCYATFAELTEKGLAPDDPRHGTLNAYGNYGCRCDSCRAAQSVQNRKTRERLAARGLPPGDRRHGTASAYNSYGCRCDDCRAAISASKRSRRASKRSAA